MPLLYWILNVIILYLIRACCRSIRIFFIFLAKRLFWLFATEFVNKVKKTFHYIIEIQCAYFSVFGIAGTLLFISSDNSSHRIKKYYQFFGKSWMPFAKGGTQGIQGRFRQILPTSNGITMCRIGMSSYPQLFDGIIFRLFQRSSQKIEPIFWNFKSVKIPIRVNVKLQKLFSGDQSKLLSWNKKISIQISIEPFFVSKEPP